MTQKPISLFLIFHALQQASFQFLFPGGKGNAGGERGQLVGDEGREAGLKLRPREYLIGDFPQKTYLQKFSFLFGQSVGLFLGFVFVNDALTKNRAFLRVNLLLLLLIFQFFFMTTRLINFFCFLGLHLHPFLKLSLLFFGRGSLLFFDQIESLSVDDGLNPLGFRGGTCRPILAWLFWLRGVFIIGNFYDGALGSGLLCFLIFILNSYPVLLRYGHGRKGLWGMGVGEAGGGEGRERREAEVVGGHHVGICEVLREGREMHMCGKAELLLGGEGPRAEREMVGEAAVSILKIIGSSHIKFLLKNIIERKQQFGI